MADCNHHRIVGDDHSPYYQQEEAQEMSDTFIRVVWRYRYDAWCSWEYKTFHYPHHIALIDVWLDRPHSEFEEWELQEIKPYVTLEEILNGSDR